MAKAAAKSTGKKKSFKKKEKKNVPSGSCTCRRRSTTRSSRSPIQVGNVSGLVQFGFAGIPRIAQGHSLRRAAGVAHGGQQGQGIRFAHCRSACERAGRGPRIGGARAVHRWHRSPCHQGSHADPAQRLPAAEKAPGLIFEVANGRMKANICIYRVDSTELIKAGRRFGRTVNCT